MFWCAMDSTNKVADEEEPSLPVEKALSVLRGDIKETVRAEVKAEVKREVQALREELRAQLHEELAQWLVTEGRVARKGKSKSSESFKPIDTSTELVDFKLKESIWDLSLLIGVDEMGWGASILVTLALLTNIIIQGVFLIIINTGLVKQEFSDRDLEGLSAWRYKIGHDSRFVGGDGGNSLVDRVCGHDLTLEMATEQMKMLQRVRNYLFSVQAESFSFENLFGAFCKQGPIMCGLALLVWMMCIDKEVNSIYDTLGAFRLLPTSKRRSILYPLADGTWELHTVCWYRRLIALFLTTLRLVTAMLLLFIGTRYLCYTTSIGDLFLNAMALELVINMDEIIFEAMAPLKAKDLLRNLAPLRMRPWPTWHGADLKAILTPLGLGGLLILCFMTFLSSSMGNLEAAESIICGGRRNFSFEYDGLDMLHVSSLPSFPEDNAYMLNAHDTRYEATKAVINGQTWRNLDSALFFATNTDERTGTQFMDQEKVERMLVTVQDIYQTRFVEPTPSPNMTVTDGDPDQESTGCHDLLNNQSGGFQNNEFFAWRRHLAESLGMGKHATVNSCSEVEQHCQYRSRFSHMTLVLMRSLCPVTCGCNSLLRGSIFVAKEFGCPTVCLSNPDRMEAWNAQCTDVEPGNGTDPRLNWTYNIFRELKSAAPFYEVEQQFRVYGCGFLHMVPEAELCVPDANTLTGRFLAGNPFRFQVVKLLTYACPVQCNCGGKYSSTARRPPDRFCPNSCICAWDMGVNVPDRPQPFCLLPSPTDANATLPAVATDERCCWLLRRYIDIKRDVGGHLLTTSISAALETMESRSERTDLLQIVIHLCLRCREGCLAKYAGLLGKPVGIVKTQVCSLLDHFWHLKYSNHTS